MANRALNPELVLTPITACARASHAAICKDAMAYLLMSHLECFYCGCRSAQKQDGHVRKWQCEKCQATNHLDENGEITDPPAVESSSDVRYAQNTGRSISPVFKFTDSTLFCPTCLKNQLLLTQNLADYLPAPSDLRYSVFEASLPAYKESLEQRYPPVCAECEPRVLERLRATSYAAKADHLGRMTARTRAAPPRSINGSGWKTLLILLGALAWWASLIGQVIWNVMGAVSTSQVLDQPHDTYLSTSIANCLRRTFQAGHVDQGCTALARPCSSFALILAVLSIWWNPLLKQKATRRGGRMAGLSEYYKVQLLTLVVKFVGWYVLGGNTPVELSISAIKGAHAFALAFTISAAIASFRAVKMDYTPQFSFLDTSPKRLVARQPETVPSEYEKASLSQSPPQSERQSVSSPTTSTRTTSTVSAFPIDKLSLSSPQSYRTRRNPPRPPPDDNATDTMDWTPSQNCFQSNTPAHFQGRPGPSAPQIQPSPFHGCLPPAPICLAHKLRNPPNRLSFHRSPPQEQQNFFNRVTGRSSALDGQENPTRPGSDYPEMAPPKFFPKSSSISDTGLENLFAGVFSLADEPPEVRATQKEQESQDPGYHLREPPPQASIRRKVSVTVLFLATLAWSSVDMSLRIAVPVQVISLFFAGAVAGQNLLEALNMNKAYWVVSDILLFGCELAAAISLTSAATAPDGGRQVGMQTVGPGLLIILALQEIWLLISAPKTGTGSSLGGSVPPTPMGLSSSQPITTYPQPPILQQNNVQRLVASTPALQSQPHLAARITPSMSKATAAVGSPSSGLLGLSLGGSSGLDDGNIYGPWRSGRREPVPNNTQRAWERGVL